MVNLYYTLSVTTTCIYQQHDQNMDSVIYFWSSAK